MTAATLFASVLLGTWLCQTVVLLCSYSLGERARAERSA